MNMRHLRILLAALLIALLTACVSAGGRLQTAGTASVFDLQLDSELDWSRIKLPRQETWTIDGPMLNAMTIFSGIKPNEHVFQMAKERKNRPDGPWFRVGMRPDELETVILDALRDQGWTNVTGENLRPAKFGDVDGIRFDISLTHPSGLIYHGTAAAAERNNKLTVIFWRAPVEYYHGRDAAAVTKMLDGMRFVK